jgi:hypothetical protein
MEFKGQTFSAVLNSRGQFTRFYKAGDLFD